MRPSRGRRRRQDDDLLGSRDLHFFQDAVERPRAIAQPVRLAAPRPFGRKAQEVRVGGNRHAEAGGERVDHVLAPDSREVEGLGRASAVSGTRGVAEEALPVFVAQEREQHVAPGVHVVRHEQQLAESRLSEVLGQQLDVAAPEVLPAREARWPRRRE